MTDGDLARVAVEHGEGHVLVRLHGEIDLASQPGLATPVLAAAGQAPRLIVDLGAVTFFDSTGMRLLDRLSREIGPERLAVVAPDGCRARLTLRICAFPADLIFESVAEAAG